MPSEYTYPYISGTGKAGTCHGVPLKPATPHTGVPMASATLKGHVSITSNSYSAVMDGIANIGPLAVSVDAGAWHDYETGVFSGGNQTSPTLDHLVQLVGYGTDKELGGTMRLGLYEAKLRNNSAIKKIYKSNSIKERHRHRYEVNNNLKNEFERKGLIFSGMSPDDNLPEIIELKNHPWFIGVQFHPEFKSRPLTPHPLFSSFIKAAKNHK